MHELPEESLERFALVKKLLRTQRSLPAKLESVAAIARRTARNCDAAGISRIVDGEPTTTAVSDRLAVEIDLVQYKTGRGPCLAAIDGGNLIRVHNLERDRHPIFRFAPAALAMDISSVLSLPLPSGDRVVGALNLYSRLPNAVHSRGEQAAQPLVDYAAEGRHIGSLRPRTRHGGGVVGVTGQPAISLRPPECSQSRRRERARRRWRGCGLWRWPAVTQCARWRAG